MSKVNIHIESNGIAFLTITSRPVNALSVDLLNELYEVVCSVKKDNSINVLIIKSDLDHFCAGADIKERSLMDDKQTLSVINKINDCFDLIESLDIITIAAINGSALGGGAELALCCDFRIGSISSTVGFPETSIGIIPGAGGTYRLPQLIGRSKAKYWIFTGRKFLAQEAFQDGYFDFLADDDELLEASIDLAEEIIPNSQDALRLAKRSIRSASNQLNQNRDNELNFYKQTLSLRDRINFLRKVKK